MNVIQEHRGLLTGRTCAPRGSQDHPLRGWQEHLGNFLPAQGLGPHAFTAEGLDSIPGWRTKVSKVVWSCQKKKKLYICFYLFSLDVYLGICIIMYIIDLYSSICVLVIYCCKMIPQNLSNLKQGIFIISVSGVRNLGAA